MKLGLEHCEAFWLWWELRCGMLDVKGQAYHKERRSSYQGDHFFKNSKQIRASYPETR